MKITSNQKHPGEYLAEATSGLTRESFATAFREFAAVQNIRISKEQMDDLFVIADAHLKERAAAQAMAKDRQKILQDFRSCKKLMAGTERRTRNVKTYVQKSVSEGRTSTRLAARYLIRQVQKLESKFKDWRYEIERWESLAKMHSPQPLGNEFIIELELFIKDEFSKLEQADQEALIGAAMAGAGLYSERAFRGVDDPMERVKMRRYRAEKYYQKMYVNGFTEDMDGAGRVRLNVGKMRKKAGKKMK